jgi:hypothetical protein
LFSIQGSNRTSFGGSGGLEKQTIDPNAERLCGGHPAIATEPQLLKVNQNPGFNRDFFSVPHRGPWIIL